MSSEHVVAMTTVGSEERAAEIGHTLIDERLAACVNLLPAGKSIFRWKGAIQYEMETVCLIKTRRDRLDALRARLLALHPYEVPELIVLDVTEGHQPYLAWIDESLR